MVVLLGRGWFFSKERIRILVQSYRVLWGALRGRRHQERITLYFKGVPFSVVCEDAVDFALIREVFIDEEYRHVPISNANVIVDVGANVGVASVYFHLLYPNAVIYSLEPNSALHDKFSKNTKDISQIHLLPYLIGAEDGEGTLHVHATSSLGSSTYPRHGTQATVVPSRRLSTLMKELSVSQADLVKFDIEGAEAQMFAQEIDRKMARYAIGEAHFDLMGITEPQFLGLFREGSARVVRRVGGARAIVYIDQS